MLGSKILVLLLPLLLLDGVYLKSSYRRPQPGKPWVAPTFLMNSTEDISKQKQADLASYVNQLYQQQAPASPESYTESRAVQMVRPGNHLRGYMCPQREGYFKYTNRCDEYVQCKNYIPITYTCPIGLHFNPYMQWAEFPCDHPSRVQCEDDDDDDDDQQLRYPEPIESRPTSSSTTTTTTTTTPPPPRPQPTPPPQAVLPARSRPAFMCPQPHGYFKYTDQCGQYVECKNYVPLMFTCPLGLHFNPRVQWTEYPCDYPSRVQCIEKQKSSPKPTTTSTTTTTTTTTPPPPTPTQAPKAVITPRPGQQPSGFRCPQPHGYYKYNQRCNDYIECKSYVPLTYTCPGGLHFNPLVPWTEYPCDHPSRVQCNREPYTPKFVTTRKPTTTTSTTTTTTTTPAPPPPTTEPPVIAPRPRFPEPDYSCPQPYGYFKHTSHCGAYVECKNYMPLMFTCPVGLHFNPSVQWTEYPCEHPSKVQCNEEPYIQKPKPTTTTSTTTSTTTTTTTTPAPALKVVTTPRPGNEIQDFVCPQPHGYFEYAGQCEGYVECKNHVPLSLTCPDGLHYNRNVPWTEYPCDQPSRAQCNQAPILRMK